MIGTRGFATRRLVLLFVAVMVGVLLAQLGGSVRVGDDRPAEPELIPEQYGGDVDRDSRLEVISYARTLRFSGATSAGDEQRLIVAPESLHVRGPLVRVEPAIGLNASARPHLTGGLVIARFINRDTVSYPAMAIGPLDTTYWWVDSVAQGRWRGLYLSSDPAIPPVELDLHLDHVPEGRPPGSPPSARWLFADEGERAWVTCGAATACRAGDGVGN